FHRGPAKAGDPDHLTSAGFAAGYGNGGAGNLKQLSKEFDDCLVGAALQRWRGQGQLQGITHGSGDGVLARAGMDLHGEGGSFWALLNGDHGFGLAPKIAVPTRTQVEPSSMAISKSCDMPMESASIRIPGRLRAAMVSRRSRNARKYRRAPSGASVNGGTVIKPRICICSSSGAARSKRSSSGSARGIPALLSSSPTLISIS